MEESSVTVDDIKFTLKEISMITVALLNDEGRLATMPDKNACYIGLIAIRDYVDGMNCPGSIRRFRFDIIKDPEERALVAGILCLYCELRYRATRGHNEELAMAYLGEHDAILKKYMRILKKKEKAIFIEALTA